MQLKYYFIILEKRPGEILVFRYVFTTSLYPTRGGYTMAGNEHKTEKELRLLKALTQSIAKAEDFSTAIDMCLREICAATGWTYGEAWLPTHDNAGLYISNVYFGDHKELREFYTQSRGIFFTQNTGLPGLVWQTQKHHWIRDIPSDSRFIRKNLAEQFHFKSALGIPVAANGRIISVLVFIMLHPEEGGRLMDILLTVVGLLGLLFKRITVEDNLRETSRALRVLSNCNQFIIRASDESRLLKDICRVIVDPGGYRMALIAFAEHDERKSMNIVAYEGFTGDYIKALNDLTWADSEPKVSLSSRVIRTGNTFIIKDISSDPDFLPWRDAALKQGFQSVIAIPIHINDETIGVMGIYAAEPDAFDTEEQKLLEELAEDVAYGIVSIRTKLEKERAKERQEHLTAIVESTTDLVVIADAQLRGKYINQGGLKLLGIDHEPESGIDIKLFLTEDAVRILEKAISSAVQNGTWSGESTLRRVDGQLIPVSQVIIAHKSLGGNLEFVSTIARDLTEYKKLQAQLFQAQKMEAMGQLAAGIGHDFNNMLTVVTGYGTMVYNAVKDNEQIRYHVEQILNASEKASDLVQSLLTFGRKHDTSFMSLDINKAITDILGLLNKLLGESVILRTELTSEPLIVMGNITQIDQVMMNLVRNANDALSARGVLTIQTTIADIDDAFIKEHGFGRRGRFACISVHDRGSGMDKDALQKIFDPFYTTKPVGKGTGLGLSVAYSIVKQHNGYIDVHSALGKGTTFFIYLPLGEEQTVESGTQEE